MPGCFPRLFGREMSSSGSAPVNVLRAEISTMVASREIPKKAEEATLIRTALAQNRLFRLLDEDARNAMVRLAELKEYKEGDVIVKQGERGDKLVVVRDGLCANMAQNDVKASSDPVFLSAFGRGACYGEQGMVYGTSRSASVIADGKVTTWEVNKDNFILALRSSPRMRMLFDRHSSVGSGNERVMSKPDFIRAMQDTSPSGSSSSGVLGNLFDIYSNKQGTPDAIKFEQFATISAIASKPDPEYDVAFLMFDSNQDGFVSLEDFKSALASMPKVAANVDINSSFFKNYFGIDGSRRLRFYEFTDFFKNLQDEVASRAYFKRDVGNKGFIKSSDFLAAIKESSSHRIESSDLEQRIDTLFNSRNSDNRQVSYAEYNAYRRIIDNLPGIRNVIQRACAERNGPISRDDFKLAAHVVLSKSVSPLETRVVFDLFDRAGQNKISIADFDAVVKSQTLSQGVRYLGKSMEAVDKATGSMETPLERMIKFCKNFGLGSVAGAIGAACVYPIDITKTRMQNQRVVVGQAPLYKNGFDCFSQLVRHEGFRAMYKGLGPQLVGVAPEKAIKLAVNEGLRKIFADWTHNAQGGMHLGLEIVAGGAAGFSQVLFTNPLEIVKIRLQVQGEAALKHLEKGPRMGAIDICKELGFSGLYKGSSACFLRDIPFSAIYFPLYATLKQRFIDQNNGVLAMKDIMLAGTMAGAPAAWLCTPADVIKTRMQVKARLGETTYSGLIDCARKVYADEGTFASHLPIHSTISNSQIFRHSSFLQRRRLAHRPLVATVRHYVAHVRKIQRVFRC
jgi:solute carrier family 25 aspartate/glutamate transporter 12/13